MLQIRIHGRGGQGVVTAAEMLSIAAFEQGRHAQALAEVVEDLVEALGVGLVLGQLPGLVLVDVFVDAIGQQHAVGEIGQWVVEGEALQLQVRVGKLVSERLRPRA